MSNKVPFKLGRVYRDKITGFEGVCTGKATFISGCDQLLLSPKVGENGEYREGRWIDDDRMIDVEANKDVEHTSTKGGPQHSPSKN